MPAAEGEEVVRREGDGEEPQRPQGPGRGGGDRKETRESGIGNQEKLNEGRKERKIY